MKKRLLYTALGLIGMMGTLAIGVVRAEAPTVTSYDSNITYTLNGDEEHLFTAGTITITDGETTITILDRNLGATAVGTGCEDSDWKNVCIKGIEDETYGYHFQWGNNHGFAPNFNNNDSFPGNEESKNYDVANVDASNYGPGNYYSGSTFIRDRGGNNGDWSVSMNDNLRGGSLTETTDGVGNTVDIRDEDYLNGTDWKVDESTVTDRRGPCPKGFHVPSVGELAKLTKMFGLDDGWNNYEEVSKAMHTGLNIPFAGLRNYYNASVYRMGHFADLWSSSPDSASNPGSRGLLLGVDGSLNIGYNDRAYALSVRCFYDSYQPFTQSFTLSFMSDGEEVGTGEVSENMTGAVPDEVTDKIVELTNTTNTGYELLGWIRSGATTTEIFEFETTPISGAWADESGNVYFIAQWTGIKYSVEFTGTDVEGTMENQTFIYDITGTLTPNAFTKNGYTFSGWTDSEGNKYTDGQEVINLTTTSGKIITLTAQRTKDKQTGGYSGGGGGMKKDNCPDGDLSPSYYDGACEGDNTQDSSAEPQNDVTPLTGGDGEARGGYSQEFLNAYERAFKNGITTMNTIDKANMDGYIKRGHLAKMVVNYVTNVLGREIPSDIPASCLSFNDESTVRESAEIKDYAIKSCALGLMGIRMKNNEFLPNDYVTRAEFGAVISRVLWGDKYNLVHTQEKPRYTDHLNALKEEGIMTKIDNPKMLEKRGYVMIMLMRSVNN